MCVCACPFVCLRPQIESKAYQSLKQSAMQEGLLQQEEEDEEEEDVEAGDFSGKAPSLSAG